MKDSDITAFSDAWTQAWETYGKPISGGATALAFNCLTDYELSDITRALTAHLRDPDAGQFPPKPADIVRHLAGRKGDQAAEAFELVFKALGRVGTYNSASFDDPLIHHTIEAMGGWQQLGAYDLGENGENRKWMEREFCEKYQAFMLNKPRRPATPLVGILAQTNGLNGHGEAIQAPIAIGRETKHGIMVFDRAWR